MKSETSRVFGLDLLRATAIVMVVLSHALRFAPISDEYKQEVQLVLGYYGVELFFVLSGFLIGRILLRLTEHPISFKDLGLFWIRRAMRTLPAYYFMLFAAPLVYLVFFGETNLSLFQIAPYFLFLQNFTGPHPEFFGVAWSLSVEEWFYFLFALLLWIVAMCKNTFRESQSVLFVLFILLVVGIGIRAMSSEFGVVAQWDSEIRKVVIFRLDAVVYGVFAAWLLSKRKIDSKCRVCMLVVGLALLVVSIVTLLNSQEGSDAINFVNVNVIFPITGIAFCLIVPFFSSWSEQGVGSMRRLVSYVSLISYSLYLVHSLVWEVFLKSMSSDSTESAMWISFLEYLAFSLLAGVVLHYVVEAPFLRMRKKIFPRQ